MPVNLTLPTPLDSGTNNSWGPTINAALTTLASAHNALELRSSGATLNVLSTGAALDDTTNDAPAIQSAINTLSALGGGTVLIPGKAYCWQTTITVPSNVVIAGTGAENSWVRKDITSSNPVLDFSGTATGYNTHNHMQGLRDISVKGGAAPGSLVRMYYVDNFRARNVLFHDNTGKMIDAVEMWDSSFVQCQWVTGGGNTGAGEPMVHLRNSAAAAGFGNGNDNCNMVWFSQCRFEDYRDGAVWVEKGHAANASNPNGIFFDSIKFETHNAGGKVIWFDDYTMHAHMHKIEFYCGGFRAGYSTPFSVILSAASQAVSFRDVRFVTGEAATITQLMELWCSVGPLVVDGIEHTSSGVPASNPTVGVVWLGGTGRSQVSNVVSADGATLVAGTHPHTRTMTYAATLAPVVTSSDLVLHVTLTGNTTVSAPTQAQAGDRLTFVFTQDATGARTVSWNAVFKVAWTPTTTANKINSISFRYDGTNWVQTATATNL